MVTDLVFDVDGVILDYPKQFISFMENEKGIAPLTSFENEASYSFDTMFPPSILGGRHISDFIIEMGMNLNYFSTIPYLGPAQSVLQKLHAAGFRIHLLTSCGNSEVTQQARRENLKAILPYISSLKMLPLGASKMVSLFSYEQGTMFFDDHERNYKAGLRAGLDAYRVLLPGEHALRNAHPDYLSGWNDLVSAIQKKFGITL